MSFDFSSREMKGNENCRFPHTECLSVSPTLSHSAGEQTAPHGPLENQFFPALLSPVPVPFTPTDSPPLRPALLPRIEGVLREGKGGGEVSTQEMMLSSARQHHDGVCI